MNFKYSIGMKTKHGIIETRYYMEWKNRHGGDMNGNFYVFDNGKSLNEILVKFNC